MRLDAAQLARFHEDGFLILPKLFSVAEVELMRAQLPALFVITSYSIHYTKLYDYALRAEGF